ncbi:MAG: alpha/beta hydrolase [Chloroflexi bacterium]|nr:alpha/beta hydrolase [Chloroflexota bacterium]
MSTKQTRHTFMVEGHQLVAYGFNTHLSQTPIVLLHGITASANSWLVGPPPVLAHYPWYSLSLPGHFPAQFPLGFASADLTPELVARLLSTAVRQLVGGRPVILIGHSTGGFAALAVAATAPELVAGVVCISGFVQGRWTGVLGMLQGLARNGRFAQSLFKANFKLLGQNRWYYRQALGFYARDKKALYTHPELAAFIALNHPDARRLSSAAMLTWFQRMPQTDITDWLTAVTAPTLVLFGDSDPIVPPAQGERIAAGLPQSQKVVFSGVGHLPTSERTPEFRRVLADWLNDHKNRTG